MRAEKRDLPVATRPLRSIANGLWVISLGTATVAPGIDRPICSRAIIALKVSTGAGEAIRTPDPNLGKVVLYP